MPGSVSGVLLDVDGTLVDSNDAHAGCWAEVLAEFGYDVPAARVRTLVGMGGDKLLPELTGADPKSELGERMSRRRQELFESRYLPHLRAFPGARPLIDRMRADGLQLVVATSASEKELNGILEVAGLQDLENRTSSSDARRSKPDPDIIESALRRAGLVAGDAIMLGDTPYDIAAAKKAGVNVVALRCGGWKDDALAGAIAIYDSPADLLGRYEDSPLAGAGFPAGRRR